MVRMIVMNSEIFVFWILDRREKVPGNNAQKNVGQIQDLNVACVSFCLKFDFIPNILRNLWIFFDELSWRLSKKIIEEFVGKIPGDSSTPFLKLSMYVFWIKTEGITPTKRLWKLAYFSTYTFVSRLNLEQIGAWLKISRWGFGLQL